MKVNKEDTYLLPDVDFINLYDPEGSYSFFLCPASHSETGKEEVRIYQTRFDNERKYYPNEYFEIVLNSIYEEIKKEKRIEKRYRLILNGKNEIQQYVQYVNGMISVCDGVKPVYDYSTIFSRINSTIENYVAQMELEKFSLEKKKFWTGFVFGLITACGILITIYFTVLKNSSTQNNNKPTIKVIDSPAQKP